MKPILLTILFFFLLSSLTIPSQRSEQEAKELSYSIYSKLKEGQNFSRLAKKYSDDPGSSHKGGEYLNIKKGMFIPELENVVFKLKENEISEPFDTRYGITIIQLIKREGNIYSINYILISYSK